MRIRKVNKTTPTQAQVIDSLSGNSATDAPSIHAVKELNIYSTRETICGYDEETVNNQTVLIPRYRKKYKTTVTSSGNINIPHGLTNYKIKRMYGTLISSTGSTFDIPSIRPAYSDYQLGGYVSTTNIVIETSRDRTGSEVDYTLEYNKTTDF